MGLLAHHFNVLPLSDAVTLLQQNKLPARAACITFDDGYADNLLLALPILEKYGLSATVFVATGFLDGGIMFNDTVLECIRQYPGDELDMSQLGMQSKHACSNETERRQTFRDIVSAIKYLPTECRLEKTQQLVELTGTRLPEDLMLSSSQLLELSERGVEIGAHTVSHPILRLLDSTRASSEIEQSRNNLVEILNKPVDLFAYPNGVPGVDYDLRHPTMLARLGFKAAVSTCAGYSVKETNIFELRRFTPWDSAPGKFLLRLLLNYF